MVADIWASVISSFVDQLVALSEISNPKHFLKNLQTSKKKGVYFVCEYHRLEYQGKGSRRFANNKNYVMPTLVFVVILYFGIYRKHFMI